MREAQGEDYEHFENSGKKRRVTYQTDSEAETTMGDEVSVMELDETAETAYEEAEKMEGQINLDNLLQRSTMQTIREIYRNLKTEKINDIYEKIMEVKEELDREIAQDEDSTIEDPSIVEYITRHLNKPL